MRTSHAHLWPPLRVNRSQTVVDLAYRDLNRSRLYRSRIHIRNRFKKCSNSHRKPKLLVNHQEERVRLAGRRQGRSCESLGRTMYHNS